MQQTIPLLRPIAPTLARVLDSPFHTLATKYIRDHLPDELMDIKAEDEAQIQALLNEPTGLRTLKTLDQRFAAEIGTLDLDIVDAAGAEPASPPTRRRRKGGMISPQFLLSLMFVAAYFCIVLMMFFVESSDHLNMHKGENSFMNELQILLGALTAGVGQILSYWFGQDPEKKSDQAAVSNQ